MKIGFFTDTYFPQVSGVSTSIHTLKTELENRGHEVYIFTTTDPHVLEDDQRIIRLPSIPFISFKDRRIMVRGMLYAYYEAKELELDIIHTHTEFGVGLLGKITAKSLSIPCVHTYHTMYEDYLHYIAKGKIIRPTHVKQLSKLYTAHLSGIVCPSQRVVDKLVEYDIDRPMSVIPTGIDISAFKPVPQEEIDGVKERHQISVDTLLLVSVSRISYEKNIQTLIKGMPAIIKALPHVKLLIVGDGPYRESLEMMVLGLELTDYVIFVGEVSHQEIAPYYQAGDIFVSASDSETQGLTYTEAMAAKTRVVAKGNVYLNSLFDEESLGLTYEKDEDFAETLIGYVSQNIPFSEEALSHKLYEISSQAFGKKIEAFYEEAEKYYQEHVVDEEDDKETMLKLFKK